eukprot:CAMPEP_0181115540 /NCGR_PEP_ID=MMETSP1071-20121207/21484_1 /TAXON_ID=35127 /ORGANISM="Thalassiosira sp., Strain NH16" /LENGTH=40 /DNA_ID= /DNA_START= /DNA_END= /DNA_ORIENTATION=
MHVATPLRGGPYMLMVKTASGSRGAVLLELLARAKPPATA